MSTRVFKNGASRRDPALCGFCKCSPINAYAALSRTPHASADGPMLVFQHPADSGLERISEMEGNHIHILEIFSDFI
jgi:hypothetical protein